MYSVPAHLDVPSSLAISILRRKWISRLGIIPHKDNFRNTTLIAYNLYLTIGENTFYNTAFSLETVQIAFYKMLEDYIFSMILPRVDRIAHRFELSIEEARRYLYSHPNAFIREHYRIRREDFSEEHKYWRLHPEEYKEQFYSSSNG